MNLEIGKYNVRVTPLRVVVVFVALMAAAFLAMLLTNKHEIDTLYSEGLRQQQLKNYQQAVDIFKQIGLRFWGAKKAEKALLRAAEIYYYDINNFRLAKDILEDLIPRSKYPECLIREKILLAGIYTDQLNKTDEAFRLLRESEKLDISDEDKLNILLTNAKICQKLENYEQVTKYYAEALKLCAEPRCVIDVKLRLASAYTSVFDRASAEKVFRELLTMPELSEEQRTRIDWQLFQNLDEQDRYQDAMKVIDRMLNRDPGNETLLSERKRLKEEVDFYLNATGGQR
jgi:tetratricopeptide (TPR) repeat protein